MAVGVSDLHAIREEGHADGVGLVGAEALVLFSLGEVEVLVVVAGVSEVIVVHLVYVAAAGIGD